MRPRVLLVLAACAAGCAHPTPSEQRAEQVIEQVKVSSSNLVIDCSPSDAEVSVDEVPRGLCSDFAKPGAGLRLQQGMHRIAVRKDGYFPYVTYYAPSGAQLSLTIQLTPGQAGEAKP